MSTSIEVLSSRSEQLSNGVTRLKRTASFVAALGVTQGGRLLLDRLRDQESPVIREVKSAELARPFYMTGTHSDIGMFIGVILEKVYSLSSDLDERIDGATIVDVGASIGMSAAYFATRYARSPVIAIEPNPRNLELLTLNAAQYDGQVQVINRALVSSGSCAILENPSVAVSRHGSFRYGAELPKSTRAESQVAVIRGDDIESFGPRIGLIKVNVEGAEKTLFDSGSMDSLLQRTNVLMVETHDRYVPGCMEAVNTAAVNNGMYLYQQPEDDLFIFAA